MRQVARSPSPTLAAVLALLAALVVVPLALAPRAEAYIYWANESYQQLPEDELLPGIGRANLDGSKVNPSFITGAGLPSGGIAVGARHIYWTNWLLPPPPPEGLGEIGTSTIARANLDGSDVNPSFIATRNNALAVAVGASHVYWTGPNSIGRAKLDGSRVNPSFIPDAGDHAAGIAADARHIYWANAPASAFDPRGLTDTGSIGRANLNGSGVDRRFIADAGTSPGSVAVDGGHIYWVEFNENEIARAKLDGTHVDHSFVTVGPIGANGLAVGARHVYWADFYGRSIGRANLNGTHVDDRFIRGADGPVGVAVNTLPDTKLAGKATAATTQGQSGTKIVVRVKLKAKEQLTVKASGMVKVDPTYKLRPKKVQVAAGKTKTLKLKPKKKAARKIAAALKRGEKAKAKLTVKLTDLAGNRETERLRVGLKR